MPTKRTLFVVAILSVACGFLITPFGPGVASRAQDQDASTLYAQAVALINEGRLGDAINALKQAVKVKPDYIEAYYRLGEAYSRLGDKKKAVDSYKQAIKYNPNSALAYQKLGGAYNEAGDPKKAAEAYSEAVRLDPKAADAHYKLGVIYVQRNKEQAAVNEYQILQSLDPKLAQQLYNLIYKPMVGVVSDGTVRLKVIATDPEGSPVTGLTSDDFQVIEERTVQPITISSNSGAPTVLGVAIDTSGSLRPIFPLVVASAKVIVDKTLPSDETLLVRFVSSDKIETLQEFTSDKQTLTKAIESLYIEGGQSAVVDAVYLSAQSVAGQNFLDRT